MYVLIIYSCYHKTSIQSSPGQGKCGQKTVGPGVEGRKGEQDEDIQGQIWQVPDAQEADKHTFWRPHICGPG